MRALTYVVGNEMAKTENERKALKERTGVKPHAVLSDIAPAESDEERNLRLKRIAARTQYFINKKKEAAEAEV